MLALKCADVAYTTLPWCSVLVWINRAYAEFWNEGDVLASRGVPVPALHRRTSCAATFWQHNVSFFNYMVLPLYAALEVTESKLHCVAPEATVARSLCLGPAQENQLRLKELVAASPT